MEQLTKEAKESLYNDIFANKIIEIGYQDEMEKVSAVNPKGILNALKTIAKGSGKFIAKHPKTSIGVGYGAGVAGLGRLGYVKGKKKGLAGKPLSYTAPALWGFPYNWGYGRGQRLLKKKQFRQ